MQLNPNPFYNLLNAPYLITLIAGYQEEPVENDDQNRVSDLVMHPRLEKDEAELIRAGLIQPSKIDEKELTNEYWLENAKKFVDEQHKKTPIEKKAKNIIFFLGDGNGFPTIAATRVRNGGEHTSLSYDNFPYLAFSKTYCVDKQVADSACSATAYLSGVKGNYDTAGINANILYKDCDVSKKTEDHTESIASWALKAGKAAGLVTTTRVTHASPSGVYAHICKY